jgi:hypothetical protein
LSGLGYCWCHLESDASARKPTPPEVVHTITDELNVNMKTAYLECPHRGKEWKLCSSPEGYGKYPYCSAYRYSKFSESDLLLYEFGDIGVPTPYYPCVTCPATGVSCDDHVEEVFIAAGISEDQNATLGEFNLWEESTAL